MRHEDWVGQQRFDEAAPAECHRDAVASLIRARAARGEMLPADWFADIAWDLMLALYAAYLDGLPLSPLVLRAAPQASSRKRWLDVIVAEGVASYDGDGARLNAKGVTAMRNYFDAMASS